MMQNCESAHLSVDVIKSSLLYDFTHSDIIVVGTIGSTNDLAKELAIRGAGHGTMVVADGQTGGRGRYGRKFFSPGGAGLYMSVLLRPGLNANETPMITVMAAVSICGAIKALTGFSPRIKWVNDILIGGKKVCGILTETVLKPDGSAAEYAIAGIGLNVCTRADDFPADIRGSAVSLYPDGRPRVSRNIFAAEIANRLLGLCDDSRYGNRRIIDEYKSLSCTLGSNIEYIYGRERGTGFAYDIDNAGRLLVKKSGDNGTLALNSGEVSFYPLPPNINPFDV